MEIGTVTLDNVFVGFLGAGLGGLIVAIVNAWHQRRLARDTALRKWRLEHLYPTIDIANGSIALFDEIETMYDELLRTHDERMKEESIRSLQRKIALEGNPSHELGHSIIVARLGAETVRKPFYEFLNAHAACMNEVNEQFTRTRRALLFGKNPHPSMSLSIESKNRLLDSVLALNQATERYAFGKIGPPTLAEMESSRERIRRLLNVFNVFERNKSAPSSSE